MPYELSERARCGCLVPLVHQQVQQSQITGVIAAVVRNQIVERPEVSRRFVRLSMADIEPGQKAVDGQVIRVEAVPVTSALQRQPILAKFEIDARRPLGQLHIRTEQCRCFVLLGGGSIVGTLQRNLGE